MQPVTVELESLGASARVIIHGDDASLARRSAMTGEWNTVWRGTVRDMHLISMAIDAATSIVAERGDTLETPQRLAITVQAPAVVA
jgi:hypothetical protein